VKKTIENIEEQRKIYLKDLEVIQHLELNAVIGLGFTDEGYPKALGFIGAKGKPDFNYRFRTTAHREKFLNDWKESRIEEIRYKQEQKAKTQAPEIAAVQFRIGEIIYNSWGYDQTNIDFYEVVKVTKATVVIKPIQGQYASPGHCDMSEFLKPLKGQFVGDEMRKKIQWYDGKASVKFQFGGFSRWKQGDQVYSSSYA